MVTKKVVAVPDLHLPWVCQKSLDYIYKVIDNEKPDIVIQLGDLYDFYSHTKFARSHDIMTPKEEASEARLGAEKFWKTIKKITPRSRKIQLLGNHCVRPIKRIQEKYPEIASMIDMKPMFTFSGIETVYDDRSWIEIEGVIYLHGYLTQLGAHTRHFMKPVVHGHSHRGGTVFFNTLHGMLWELDCGYLADKTQAPLMYGPTKNVLWTKGLGIVDSYGPRFVIVPGQS